MFYDANIFGEEDNDFILAPASGYQDGADDNNGNGAIELWLDLRDTSLTPKTALELWHLEGRQNNQNDDMEEDSSLALAPFVKCLVSPAKNKNENHVDSSSSTASKHNNIDVVVVAEDAEIGEDMKSMMLRNNCIGKVLSLQTSSSVPVLPDPLPAMEVLSQGNGQWMILDTNGWKKIDEEERTSISLPLVELISSGASPSAASCGGGGIGITCYTNNEVVKAAMFIQNMMMNNGVGEKTLESGIVVPNDYKDDVDTTSILGGSGGIRNRSYAIVVPYDMGLLKTASLLFGDDVVC